MGLITAVIVLAAALSLVMAGAWLAAERTGNHGWVDTVWSFATGATGIVACVLPVGDGWMPRQIVVAVLVGGWSLRLGTHILRRTMAGRDDPRYAALRAQWGRDAPRRLFLFLQVQALAALVLVLAVAVAAHSPLPFWRWGDGVGITLALAAFAGETIADRQLARFRSEPARRGEVCDAGLWGLTRHPNYFFEWLGWLAYPAIAIVWSGAHPFGFLALAAPLLMYVLLVHGSGIPPTEAHMMQSRREKYTKYQQRVNAFWPGPPRGRKETS